MRGSGLLQHPAVLLGLAWMAAAVGGPILSEEAVAAGEAAPGLRIAVFNIRELSTEKLATLDDDGAGADPQTLAAARIVQLVRPDILLIQEIDAAFADGRVDPELNPRRLAERFLARGEAPIEYPYVFTAPTNTGILSGVDLDGDGRVAGADDLGTRVWGGDSLGWGEYPGQYSMAVLSRWPIDRPAVRTFRRLLWRDLPANHMPPGFYSEAAAGVLPLSSKSHWDVPILVGEGRLHLWISHPTPPVFDGSEDRNGRRNFDEIRFWTLYPEGWQGLVDDQGRAGGAPDSDPFVVLGDLNADPRSETRLGGQSAISHLLEELEGVQDPGSVCSSAGALAGRSAGPPNHPERATAVFGDGMRLDYILPSEALRIVGGGVFWPAADADPVGHALSEAASDHRLVWIDVELSVSGIQSVENP